MRQNINLYDPALRRRREWLTAATVAQCVGATLIALFAYHYSVGRALETRTAELAAAEAELAQTRAAADKAKAKAAAYKPDPKLEAEIAALESELREARAAMQALQAGAFGNREGFSEYLRAFSRQTIHGLWLTGFTITGEGEIELRGRVLSPDLVAGYIQRLNREAVLQGRGFARFEMAPPAPAPAKGPAEGGARPARFLEFSLATSEAPKAERAR
jgi:multidrug efflux pump subunit AcrA (membrane-fusion protein)